MIRRKPSQDYKLYLVKNLPNLKNTDDNGIIDEIEKKEERKEKILLTKKINQKVFCRFTKKKIRIMMKTIIKQKIDFP